MVLLEDQTQKINYHCIENDLALFCQENEKEQSVCDENSDICIPKCCPSDQVFNVDHMHCDKTTEAYFYKPEVFSSQTQLATLLINKSVSLEYFILSDMQFKFCPRNHDFFYPSTKVLLLSDGNLYVDNGEVISIYNRHFCVDNFYIHSENKPFVSAFVCNNVSPLLTFNHSNLNQTNLRKRVYPKGCSAALTDLHNFDQRLRLVYSICGIISEIFILVTLIFYLAIPKLKNHQGQIVIANLISIFITTGLLVNVNLFLKIRLYINHQRKTCQNFFVN